VPRLVTVAYGVEGLVPGRQYLAGIRVEVCTGVLIPDRQVPAVVLDVRGGPPDLVVGGGDDLAELLPGDGAADGEVDVRGEPALWFDGGEVLQVIPGEPAQVLDEPVEQRGEVQRVPRRLGVVVDVRVGGCSVLADPAVGRAGQGDEQGGPEGLAVRRSVGLADRLDTDRAPRQRAGTPRIVRAGPSSVKGTRRSFLTASQKRSLGPPLSAGA
jgi:hypothetical protein